MEFQPPGINFVLAAPVIIVAITGMFLMLLELFVPGFVKKWAAWIAFVGLALSLVLTVRLWGQPGGTFTAADGSPMLVVDNFAVFLNVIFFADGHVDYTHFR